MSDMIESALNDALAFLFPGQGSQKMGMGLELSEEYAAARATFDEADAILNRKLSQLCFEGPAEALKQTENTQLAILTCSVAALRVLNERGIVPKAVAGHSLGEYSALVAADVLDLLGRAKVGRVSGTSHGGSFPATRLHNGCNSGIG